MKGIAMPQWDEKTPRRADRVVELAIDLLTLVYLNRCSTREFRKACDEFDGSIEKKALVVAWERVCISTIDLMSKSVDELYDADPEFKIAADNRWEHAQKLIASTLPIVTVMVENDQIGVPKILDMFREIERGDRSE